MEWFVRSTEHIEKGLEKSVIIGSNETYLVQLSRWLRPVSQNNSSWKLCWRGSRDGWASTTFHSLCHGKGPTVTIIKVNQNIFGGYASVSWEPENCGVKTTGGICCHFPFIYNGKVYKNCTTKDNGNTPWCSTTASYDQDGQYGNCLQIIYIGKTIEMPFFSHWQTRSTLHSAWTKKTQTILIPYTVQTSIALRLDWGMTCTLQTMLQATQVRTPI